MTASLSFLAVLALSLLMVRIATVALIHTGLSKSTARFQARSAFSGTGFTTSESESVVDHPVRRRIVGSLMLVRNAGLIGAISSLFLSFVSVADDREAMLRAGLIVAGLMSLWLLSTSSWFDRRLSMIISWALNRWTDIEHHDYEDLLKLSGSYRIYEIGVDREDWLAGRRLDELELPSEGVQVLGVHRKSGKYLGVPDGETDIKAGDRLVLYGRQARLRELDVRKADAQGEKSHADAAREHVEEKKEQEEKEGAA